MDRVGFQEKLVLPALSSFKYGFLISLLGKIIYLECCMYITEDLKNVLAKYNGRLCKEWRGKKKRAFSMKI